MFQIAEVQQPPAELFLRKSLGQIGHQIAHGGHHGGGGLSFCPDGVGGLEKALLRQGGKALQKPFPPGLDTLQKGLVLVAAAGQTALVKGPQARIGLVPAGLDGLPQAAAKGQMAFQQRAVFCPHFLHRPGQCASVLQPPQGVVQTVGGFLPHMGHPLQAIRLPQAQLGQQSQQLFGVRVAAHFFKHFQHRLGQHPVGTAIGEGVAQGSESRLSPDVSRLQGVVEDLFQQQLALGLVGQTEVGLYPTKGEVLPDEALTKGVDRLDAGRTQ